MQWNPDPPQTPNTVFGQCETFRVIQVNNNIIYLKPDDPRMLLVNVTAWTISGTFSAPWHVSKKVFFPRNVDFFGVGAE